MRGSFLSTAMLAGGLLMTACSGAAAPAPAVTPAPKTATTLGTEQPEHNATGAVVTVTAEDRGGQHHNLIAELFKGQIPGVQVIGSSLRIRGVAQNMTGGQEPLLILDGMPAPGGVLETLRGINPDDVESIQVLKDVSSTSIYGTRGAGGVIIVTTKND